MTKVDQSRCLRPRRDHPRGHRDVHDRRHGAALEPRRSSTWRRSATSRGSSPARPCAWGASTSGASVQVAHAAGRERPAHLREAPGRPHRVGARPHGHEGADPRQGAPRRQDGRPLDRRKRPAARRQAGCSRRSEPLDFTSALGVLANKADHAMTNVEQTTDMLNDPKLHEDIRASLDDLRLILDGIAHKDSAAHRLLLDPDRGGEARSRALEPRGVERAAQRGARLRRAT